MKKILALCFSLFFGAVIGGLFGAPVIGATVLTGANIFGSHPSSSFLAGVYVEIWTGEQVKAFRTDVSSLGWLNAIPSYDQYVRPGVGNEADIIHLVVVGADPKVLINNTTYPIAIVDLPDGDKAISLDKYQTEATPITDDELHAISIDKMGSVIERHRDAVNETKYAKAIHALAPQSNSTATPVIVTTGDADETGRKAITRKDIIKLKKAFDKLKVPTKGRILVLCSDHVNDLLQVDQKFADQYYNYTTGKISNLCGFEIYEYTECPYYTQAGAKVAYGGVPSATDTQASVAYYAPRMFKATGTTTTYPTPAEATRQQHLYNVRHYFVCLPKKNEAIGAIYSAATTV